ncbi:MAG: hypothetical protein WA810_10650 [Maribacter sp.]
MNTMQLILTEITCLTSIIKINYPELYPFLDENPMTIPSYPHPNIDKDTLGEYRDELKQLIKHHSQTHKVRR